MTSFVKRKSDIFASDRILYLHPSEIKANPHQPRKVFDPDQLLSLSKSISEVGVLQPLTVRKLKDGYELVSGERRLRASKLAGLSYVPCIVAEISDENSALLALVENLQRRDLDFFEEANGIAKLLSEFHLTQQEAADRLGKSQSAIANKLRLLRLDGELIYQIRQKELSERHARALLRLEEEKRAKALKTIILKDLNVAQTENYIDSLLELHPKPATGQKKFIIKDIRIFINTIDHAISVIRRAGLQPDFDRQEDDQNILMTIKIPKTQMRAAD